MTKNLLTVKKVPRDKTEMAFNFQTKKIILQK